MIAPVACDPDSALLPLQPPDAVQEVTLFDDQFNVVEPPGATPAGDALKLADGDVDELIVTFARATAPPPAPLQVIVNWVFAVIAGLVSLPLVPLLPVQPPPDAVQVSAFELVHDSVVVPPEETLVGLAVRFTVGGL